MKKYKQILWLLIGAALIASLFINQPRFIDAHTIDLIDQARQLDLEKYWPGYQPDIYPVEVYKKNLLKSDSIIRYDKNEIYEIKNKTPIYALSMDVDPDGQAVLMATTARDFRSLSDVGNYDGPSADLSYQAVLLHEAFHCFQFDQGFYDLFEKSMSAYKKSTVVTTSRKLDNDPEYQKLWIDEMNRLIDYAKEDNAQNHQAYVNSYQVRLDYVYSSFDAKDADEYLSYSALYEKAEGTAQYIENMALSQLSGKELKFSITGYGNDTSKFYDSGFLKAYILDQKEGLDWKTDFFKTDKTFEDYLLEADCL
ncbi:MAG: hypothetical protein ACOX7B_15935 [Christensenellales bacterium]|jgi:hypothetical protein